MANDDFKRFDTFGVVLIPEDFSLTDWPDRAAQAGLTTIGLHHGASVQYVVEFVESDQGRQALDRCRELGLQVEYELHAMRDLLPRTLFDSNPEMFRMDSNGNRTPDANGCACSIEALEIIGEQVILLSDKLRPTTHRYFLWGDDGAEGCQCPKCKGLGFSDQALLIENFMLKTLRSFDPMATLAHLAYEPTYRPPTQVKPGPGIFLEFAPIRRSFESPISNQPEHLDVLDANLEWFGNQSAQVLDYWLDVSLFSHWKRPTPELPDRSQVIAADLNAYAKRGIQHITNFAVMLDREYVDRFGDRPLNEYGAANKSKA